MMGLHCCCWLLIFVLFSNWTSAATPSAIVINPANVTGLSDVATYFAPNYPWLYFSTGFNVDGQLGFGNREPKMNFTVYSAAAFDFSYMSNGDLFVLALNKQGVFHAWGSNWYGQLGLGDLELREAPTPVSYFVTSGLQIGRWRRSFVAASSPTGESHAVAVTESGKVFAWGRNQHGQLGLSHFNDSSVPVEITRINPTCRQGRKVLIVAASKFHSYSIDDSGQLYSWGLNAKNLLAIPQIPVNSNFPTPVPAISFLCQTNEQPVSSGITGQIATSFSFILDATAAGSTTRDGYFAGYYLVINSGVGIGQVRKIRSHNSATLSIQLEEAFDECAVPFAGTYYEIRRNCKTIPLATMETGWDHAIALDTSNNLWAWGGNERGQLCSGSFNTISNPSLVTKLQFKSHSEKIVDISVGFFHNLILTSSGMVHAWGGNSRGQLGKNHTNDDPCNGQTFVAFGPLTSNISSIAAGGYHSAAISIFYKYSRNDVPSNVLFRKPDVVPRVFLWGDNSRAQLGLPLNLTFTNVPIVSEVFKAMIGTAVWLGGFHTIVQSAFQKCPNDCSGHGLCQHDVGTCTCFPPWNYEFDCATAFCPNDCVGRGICDHWLGKCNCPFPSYGIDCSLVACPNNCTNDVNGWCDTSVGICYCNENVTARYIGIDCFSLDPGYIYDPIQYYSKVAMGFAPFFTMGPARTLNATDSLYLLHLAGSAPSSFSLSQVLFVINIVVSILMMF